MARERISIDELLARQIEPPALLVTIEPIDGDDTKLAVTPYSAEAGCSCGSTLKINKDLVDWVVPTDQLHNCCGKRFVVVEIGFKDAILTDVFAQLADNGRMHAVATKMHSGTAPVNRFSPIGGPPVFYGAIGAGGIRDPDQLAGSWYDKLVCNIKRAISIKACAPYALTDQDLYQRCLCEADYDYNVCVYGPQAVGPSPC